MTFSCLKVKLVDCTWTVNKHAAGLSNYGARANLSNTKSDTILITYMLFDSKEMQQAERTNSFSFLAFSLHPINTTWFYLIKERRTNVERNSYNSM